MGLIPGLGRPPGGGHGNLLQYSCLDSPHGQEKIGGLQSMGLQGTAKRLITEHNVLPLVEIHSIDPYPHIHPYKHKE